MELCCFKLCLATLHGRSPEMHLTSSRGADLVCTAWSEPNLGGYLWHGSFSQLLTLQARQDLSWFGLSIGTSSIFWIGRWLTWRQSQSCRLLILSCQITPRSVPSAEKAMAVHTPLPARLRLVAGFHPLIHLMICICGFLPWRPQYICLVQVVQQDEAVQCMLTCLSEVKLSTAQSCSLSARLCANSFLHDNADQAMTA